ncbi:hypothetical protein RSAG8_07340, partial [Rhizoctonia solani AG-8 WAC10335]
MSVISAFTLYLTTPSWRTNPYVTRFEPTDNTPYPTFTDNESWDNFNEFPDHCSAFWMTHRQGLELGPWWYFFHNTDCPTDAPTYNMYEEFDDWEYIPNNNWLDNSVFIPAILSAREDPLGYFAYTSQDLNNWVNDLLNAINMTIKPRWSNNDNDSDWGSNMDWGVVQST